jgi:hypothetical protein
MAMIPVRTTLNRLHPILVPNHALRDKTVFFFGRNAEQNGKVRGKAAILILVQHCLRGSRHPLLISGARRMPSLPAAGHAIARKKPATSNSALKPRMVT